MQDAKFLAMRNVQFGGGETLSVKALFTDWHPQICQFCMSYQFIIKLGFFGFPFPPPPRQCSISRERGKGKRDQHMRIQEIIFRIKAAEV